MERRAPDHALVRVVPLRLLPRGRRAEPDELLAARRPARNDDGRGRVRSRPQRRLPPLSDSRRPRRDERRPEHGRQLQRQRQLRQRQLELVSHRVRRVVGLVLVHLAADALVELADDRPGGLSGAVREARPARKAPGQLVGQPDRSGREHLVPRGRGRPRRRRRRAQAVRERSARPDDRHRAVDEGGRGVRRRRRLRRQRDERDRRRRLRVPGRADGCPGAGALQRRDPGEPARRLYADRGGDLEQLSGPTGRRAVEAHLAGDSSERVGQRDGVVAGEDHPNARTVEHRPAGDWRNAERRPDPERHEWRLGRRRPDHVQLPVGTVWLPRRDPRRPPARLLAPRGRRAEDHPRHVRQQQRRVLGRRERGHRRASRRR